MNNPAIESIIQAPLPAGKGRGGFRPGAGRKSSLTTSAAQWQRLEARVRATAGKVLTRARLEEMARADPWRFVERVIVPLLGMEKRQAGNVARLGISLSDGERVTQFVLDLAQDADADAGAGAGYQADYAAPLEQLAAYGERRA